MRRTRRRVCRVDVLQPSAGELFYFREILMALPGRSYEDLRTHEEVLHATFHDAAAAQGIVSSHFPGERALASMADGGFPPQVLRCMFVMFTLDGTIRPSHVLDLHEATLLLDFRAQLGGRSTPPAAVYSQARELLLPHSRIDELVRMVLCGDGSAEPPQELRNHPPGLQTT